MNPIISFRLDKPDPDWRAKRRFRIDWPFIGITAVLGGLSLFFVWLGWQLFKWMVRQALIGG